MRPFLNIFLFIIPVVFATGSTADIASSKKRLITVDLARTLTTPPQFEGGADYIVQNDPFTSVKRNQAIPENYTGAKRVGLSDRDKLMNIAAAITPSGIITVGGTDILLFGQKKLKAGDFISIQFEGSTYSLQVRAIERTSYTLRFNQEEITRPIKTLTK